MNESSNGAVRPSDPLLLKPTGRAPLCVAAKQGRTTPSLWCSSARMRFLCSVGLVLIFGFFCFRRAIAAGALPTTLPVIKEESLGKLSAYDKIKVIVVSGDGMRIAFIGTRGKQQWVVRDGVESPAYDWVVPASLVLSPDGSRCAFIVQTATQTIPVVDGVSGPGCFAIGGNRVILTREGKRFAYVAQLGDADKGSQLVADGTNGPTYDAIDYPMFSADGTHLACRAAKGKQQLVVLDGQPQKGVDGIVDATMVFSPDSKHLTYGVIEAGATHVMLDGIESPAYERILLGPGFSALGNHLATVVIQAGKTFVVLDGKGQPPFDGLVAGDLTFSPDGNHLAYGAKRGAKSMVIFDGSAGESFDDLANSTLRFSHDSQHLAYEAISNGKSVIVLDGRKLDAFDGGLVGTPIFSSDGAKLLFGCKHDNKWLIVVWDGKQRTEVGPFDSVADPGFSPDGKRVAFRCIDKGKFFADVDGVLSPALEAIGPIVFSPDSRHVVYLARIAGHSHLIIDGVATEKEFDARLSGETPEFNAEGVLHLLTLRDKEIFLEKVTLK